MLLKREELRNRIIRLAGQGKLVAATKFVDEAASRVSRFLLMQAIVNACFGILFGLGLLAIGVKYAMLWGFLGAMLRYLPYIGPYLAVTFPVSLSIAMSEGWGATLAVIGLFLVLELTIANFIEPKLYGQSMGVSEIAMLVSAAFWAFLWGPIGLVLSSPLTVCLVVLGRYIPQLEFLSVILGDEPRSTRRSASTSGCWPATRRRPRTWSSRRWCAGVARPDLRRDAPAGPGGHQAEPRFAATSPPRTSDTRWRRSATSPRTSARAGSSRKTTAEKTGRSPSLRRPRTGRGSRILACAARDAEDEVALEMLAHLLGPSRWDVGLLGPETLTAELLDMVARRRPAAVCIAAVPPGGLAHTRYLCKRLRSRFPELKILVGRWFPAAAAEGDKDAARPGAAARPRSDREADALEEATADAPPAAPAALSPMVARLEGAGANFVATTLQETRRQLDSLVPILVVAASAIAMMEPTPRRRTLSWRPSARPAEPAPPHPTPAPRAP